jgi:hypothetical protein
MPSSADSVLSFVTCFRPIYSHATLYWPQTCAVAVGKYEWWGENTANSVAITEGGRDIWDGSELCRPKIWGTGEMGSVGRICINLH